MRNIVNIFVLSILCANIHTIFSQEDFLFRRKIELKSDAHHWHYFQIPDELYEKSTPDFSDVRIYRINKKDTLEVPYLIVDERLFEKEQTFVSAKIINVSQTSEGHYFTLENTHNQKDINTIILQFSQQNFDWKVNLQGSHNQNEWFDILTDYRIVAIKNQETEYRFEKLIFGNTNYKYYRILVKTDEKSDLKKAIWKNFIAKNGDNFKKQKIENLIIKNDNKRKKTIIDFSLKHKCVVHSLEIEVDNDKNFYRPVRIDVVDSLKTNRGTLASYSFFDSGILTSLENEEFMNRNQEDLVKNFRITIENNDNKPLKIKSVKLKTVVKGIIFETEEKGDYFLYYGNKKIPAPKYDLIQFAKQITEQQKDTVFLSNEISLNYPTTRQVEPLFQNKMWLWLIMGGIILVLGYFSLKMISKK